MAIVDVVFDARPDRNDLRDRPYQPRLQPLPGRFPSTATFDWLVTLCESSNLILTQGPEGACTGFALASVVNYLNLRQDPQVRAAFQSETEAKAGAEKIQVERVSPRMLYEMARRYDEWTGEGYEGSSCRGALKGWQRHGVCSEGLWPYVAGVPNTPQEGWQIDAAQRTLGAYYRIDRHSLTDLQAAICEVGAIYCSATAHRGWKTLGHASSNLWESTIAFRSEDRGGHAFAIVGYLPWGFIVQNSWGVEWGRSGFGVLTYQDWLENGMDAWVATTGAPILIDETAAPSDGLDSDVLSSRALASRVAAMSPQLGRNRSATAVVGARPVLRPGSPEGRDVSSRVEPEPASDTHSDASTGSWTEARTRRASVFLDGNGEAINSHLDVSCALAALRKVCVEGPLTHLREACQPRLVLYVDDGLLRPEEALSRFRALGPVFCQDEVVPLFLGWHHGLGPCLDDWLLRWQAAADGQQLASPRGVRSSPEAVDRTTEAACRSGLVHAWWTEFKESCARSSCGNGVAAVLPGLLTELAGQCRARPELHLVGHSGGAFLIGHLLSRLGVSRQRVASLTLYAPACDTAFAMHHFATAINRRLLRRKTCFVHVLSDEWERADTVQDVYQKSFLYFASRALERYHKTPLIGMARVGEEMPQARRWHASYQESMRAWQGLLKSIPAKNYYVYADGAAAAGPANRLTHRSFPESPAVLKRTREAFRHA